MAIKNFKIEVKQDYMKEPLTLFVTIEGKGNTSGYGSGEYIELRNTNGSHINLYDMRYSRQSFEQMCRTVLTEYYGVDGLKTVEEVDA